jgi:hypothetical protein
VKDKYGKAALKVAAGGSACCGSVSGREADPITSKLYTPSETSCVPAEAAAASLGCGNPTALADLKAGETVLDLGRAAASTCSSRPSAWDRRARPTAST